MTSGTAPSLVPQVLGGCPRGPPCT